MKSRCETCEGKKVVYGFGGMKKACPDCGSKSGGKRVAESKLDKRSKEYRAIKKTKEA